MFKLMIVMICILSTGVWSADSCDIRLQTEDESGLVSIVSSGTHLRSFITQSDEVIVGEFQKLVDIGLCTQVSLMRNCKIKEDHVVSGYSRKFFLILRDNQEWTMATSKSIAEANLIKMRELGLCR